MTKVSLAQLTAENCKDTNLCKIENFAKQAAKNGSRMLFLPEYSMFYTKINRTMLNENAAEPLDGPFVSALGRIARQNGLWIAAGLYERGEALPYNTAVILDESGTLRGFHRKQKLYDAFGYRESDECRAGQTPFSPLDTPAGRLGIITCFELRFPALAAAQRDKGAEVLWVPAGWAKGSNKLLHWRTLLCARAIENGLTVLGVDQYRERCFIGHSAAFAPDGTCLGALEEGEGLIAISI